MKSLVFTCFLSIIILNTAFSQKINDFSSKTDNKSRILFQESFSKDTLDHKWVINTRVDRFLGYDDPYQGKVLKVNIPSSETTETCLLECNITDFVVGKVIKLNGLIETNGLYCKDSGKLGLKYTIGNREIHFDVKGFKNYDKWSSFYAQQSKRFKLNNTIFDKYTIFIPKTAKNVVLYLGVSDCIGSILFKDITIYEVKY